MEVDLATYCNIKEYFASSDDGLEHGGMMGVQGDVVCAFYEDCNAHCTEISYMPDVATLNCIIESWSVRGISFAGIIHSHAQNKQLSKEDIAFARCILASNGQLESILFATVIRTKTQQDSKVTIHPFRVYPDEITLEKVHVVLGKQ